MITQAPPLPTIAAGVLDQVRTRRGAVNYIPQAHSSLPDGDSGLGTIEMSLGSGPICGVSRLVAGGETA